MAALLGKALKEEWHGFANRDQRRISGGWNLKSELWELNRRALTEAQSRGEDPGLSRTTTHGVYPRNHFQSRLAASVRPDNYSKGDINASNIPGVGPADQQPERGSELGPEGWRKPTARGVKFRGVEYSDRPRTWSSASSSGAPEQQAVPSSSAGSSATFWPEEEEADFCFKVVLLGDRATGKSAFLARVARENCIVQLTPDLQMATVRTACRDPFGLSDRDVSVKVRLWDMRVDDAAPAHAGVDSQRLASYLHGADGAIVFYDITRKSTLDNAEARWAPLAGTRPGDASAPGGDSPELGERKGWWAREGSGALVMLLGTHRDRAGVTGTLSSRGSLQLRRAVPAEEGKSAAALMSAAFAEVSCAEPSTGSIGGDASAAGALDLLVSELFWRQVHDEARRAGVPAALPARPAGSQLGPAATAWLEAVPGRARRVPRAATGAELPREPGGRAPGGRAPGTLAIESQRAPGAGRYSSSWRVLAPDQES